MDHHLNDASTQNDFNEDEALLKSHNSSVDEADHTASTTDSSSAFECNICLDTVKDPVVTLCGHLYCWSCIYKWIRSCDITSSENQDCQIPRCPVCKKDVSEERLIPLYGRGQTSSTKNEPSNVDCLIPQRPRSSILRDTRYYASGVRTIASYDEPFRGFEFGLGDRTRHLIDPMIGMFGYSDRAMHSYPDSYHLAYNNSPRLRRWLKEADRSLSRICFFLCCCVFMCLILF